MTSNKPYLVRGLYDWIVDNGCTPYLVVDVQYPGVEVPQEFVKDGKITLNVSPTAIRDYEFNNEFLSFSARFSGVAQHLFVPVESIMVIFARENGQGMAFDVAPVEPDPDSDREESTKTKPTLKVVK
ncbi:ClpXP protease specificity-enhancing factor [Gynuella sp.]|uniref:ClpXP protease specificity-enhancing factor n=1 Tax=Gynuella sp. TaxID=2969146 RepID=UPI003D0AA806